MRLFVLCFLSVVLFTSNSFGGANWTVDYEKSIIQVMLQERLFEKDLAPIAEEVLTNPEAKNRSTVCFYLPNQRNGWACVYLIDAIDRKYRVSINNCTKEEWDGFASRGLIYPDSGELFGVWNLNQRIGNYEMKIIFALFKWNKNNYLHRIFDDGSSTLTTVELKGASGTLIVTDPDDRSLYYIVSSGNQLQVWDKKGLVEEYTSVYLLP